MLRMTMLTFSVASLGGICINWNGLFMFLGGLGIFMYGVQRTSTGLQRFAAHRLRDILQTLTHKTYLAVLSGIVMTVAFQSSTATTVLVVEFVNAGMLNLGQALGVMLGSAVGTSVIIQLIAFNILNIALALIFIGFILFLVINTEPWIHLGQALIGFGLIFVGIANMSGAFTGVREIPEFQSLMIQLEIYPLLTLLLGVVLTALMQSSAATLAILISLADQGLVRIEAALPMVLGAHIGGTVTTLVSALAASKQDAKRAALANFAYKVLGALLIYPLLSLLSDLLQTVGGDMKRQIANAHLVLSLFMLGAFLPFTTFTAKLLVRILPGTKHPLEERHFRYIDENALSLPAVALKQVRQEIFALGELQMEKMLAKVPQAIQDRIETPSGRGSELEKQMDWYYRNIASFLSALSMQENTEEGREEILHFQFILKEFAYIGDAQLDLMTQLQRLAQQGRLREKFDWLDIEELYLRVRENNQDMLAALKNADALKAGKVIREHPEILRIQRSIQFALLQQEENLGDERDKAAPSLRWQSLDVIDLLSRINEHSVNIAQVIMGLV